MPASLHPAASLRVSGALLLGIALAGYLLLAQPVHWTALIPAGLGLLVLSAAWLRREPALLAALGICAIALFGGGSALPLLPMLVALGGLVALGLTLIRRSVA